LPIDYYYVKILTMKVSILQENLIKGLNTASRSVASRAQLPILSHVLLVTDKGRLKISATNLETGVNLWLGAKVEKEGQITIPAKILTELVSSLPAQKVDLEVKENQLFISCGAYQADFVGLPASEFPKVPTLTGKPNFTFEGESLALASHQVAFAAATDEGRPILTGVLLTLEGSQLLLVATDGYRLSLKKLANTTKGQEEVKEFKKGLIIPARTLVEVARVVNDSEEKSLKLGITPEANQAIFALPEVEIVSRLIEGSFPDFEKIVPEKGATKIILDKEELTRSVRMASIFARESANIIKFEVRGSKFKVSANTAQVGSNLSEIEAKIEGKENKIAFNSRYLLDFLSVVGSEQVTFEMSGSLNPGVFTPAGDSSFTHIIMPVRVQE